MSYLESFALHPQLRNKDEISKFRHIFLFCMSIVGLFPQIVFLHGFLFQYPAHIALQLLLAGLTLVSVYSIYLQRFAAKYKIPAIITLASSYVVMLVMIFFAGSFDAPGYFWIALFPFSFGLLLGKKWGIVGGVASLISAVFFIQINEFAQPYKILIDPEIFYQEKIVNLLLFCCTTTLISVMFSEIADKSFRNLLQQKSYVEDLLRIVVHDIANPLAILEAKLELMDKKHHLPLKDMQTLKLSLSLLRSITSSVRSMMLDNLSVQESELEIVDLIEVAQNAKIFFSEISEPKGIQIKLHSNLDRAWIKAQKNILINQVINNFLSNAIKFSPENSAIEMKVFVQGSMIAIEIKDHGVGIAEHRLGSIFNLQAGKSTKGLRGEKGTGFGLNIAYKFIKYFGGDIKVKSSTDPGESGTAFMLLFPSVSQASIAA